MHDPLYRLYRTKTALLASASVVLGVVLLTIGLWATHGGTGKALALAVLVELGGGLFTTGLLGIGLQYFIDADKAAVDGKRLREAITEASPALRDAVIDGFAFEPTDLARVATPEVLDQVVENGLALRLGDAGFARDLYRDLQQQTIAAPERLHDARVSIHLSPFPLGKGKANGRAPLYVATVRWESSLRPKFKARRFSAVSDLTEYRELTQDKAAHSAWYVGPRTGLDASEPASFQLLDFAVDGRPLHIQRTAKRGSSQTYSVLLPADNLSGDKRMTLTYTYRTLLAVDEHLLQVRVDQPTHGLSIELDYGSTTIAAVNVLDFITGNEVARIGRSPAEVPDRTITVDYTGWVMPRSGVAFVWRSRALTSTHSAS